MLQEVEVLAAQLYGSATSNEQRAEAERQLSVFSNNPEMLDQARMILETSQQSYAQHLAATAMSKLLTANWGRFSDQQRIDMRQYVRLSYMHAHNNGPTPAHINLSSFDRFGVALDCSLSPNDLRLPS